jgi:NitT/TauT family transport system substrate-binding protein
MMSLKSLVILVAFFLTGCSGSNRNSESKTFKVATFTWVGYAPINLAKEKGFFEGVEVELSKIDDTAARRAALSSGQVNGSVDIVDSFVCARSSGVPASVVLKLDDSIGGDGIVAKKSIKSITDLRGKTVAFPKDQPSHFFLLSLLEKEGMSMKDLTGKGVNEADQAGNAFVSGSVDAAVTWEPYLTKAAQMPDGHILTSSRETPGLIVDVFTVRDDYLKSNPKEVEAFIKGWFKAVQYWKDNPSDANEIMAKALKLETKEFSEMIKGIKYADLEENQAFFKFDGNGSSRFTVLAGQASKVWVREGIITKEVAPASIDGSQIVQAVK